MKEVVFTPTSAPIGSRWLVQLVGTQNPLGSYDEVKVLEYADVPEGPYSKAVSNGLVKLRLNDGPDTFWHSASMSVYLQLPSEQQEG